MANVVEVVFRGVDQISQNTAQINSSLAGIQRLALRAGGALTAAFSVREVVAMADAMQTIENRIRLVTDSTAELNAVQRGLFGVAQETRTQFESVVGLYGRAALAADELNATQEELITFTELVGQGLAIQGGAASEASGALHQLSQSLGSGIVRAEEFNSVLEGAFPIAQAAARGIDEAGGSVARLRQLVIEGEITSREFFEGLLSQADEMAETFGETESTIGQALTRLRNSTLNVIGALDDATGATSLFSGAIILLSEAMDLATEDGSAFNAGLEIGLDMMIKNIPVIGQLATIIQFFGNESAEAAEKTDGFAEKLEEIEVRAKRIVPELREVNTQVGALVGIMERLPAFDPTAALLQGVETTAERMGPVMRDFPVFDPSAITEPAEEAFEQVSVFAEQAARNAQDVLAEFLFDPFKEGLDGMLAGFIDVIRRMVAEAAAAKLLESLFGKEEEGGGLGGFFQGLFSGLFGKGKAHGGFTSPGVLHPVNEREPEFLLTRGRSEVVPLSKAAASGIPGGGAVFAPQTTFQLMTAPLSRDQMEEFTQSREDIMFARFKKMLRDDGVD